MNTMKVKFYGTRGSIPVCDRDFQDFGGNTTCVMLTGEYGQVAILDAGSGIRNLGKDLIASGHEQDGPFSSRSVTLAMKLFNRLAILLIRAYQRLVSPRLQRRGRRCLHHPSCSEYGVLAFKKYGFLKATLLTWRRYQDCHPFSDRPYIDFP